MSTTSPTRSPPREVGPSPPRAGRELDARLLPVVARWVFVVMGVLPWIVPLLRAWLPLGAFGEGLDAAFVTMCHRLPERTMVLAGVAMPVCSRCAGVFGGVTLGALILRPRLSAAAWRWAITAGGALMLIDVATQDLGIHPVWHATRLLSGGVFGYALGAACVLALQREAAPTSQASEASRA
jgi:uncharacterized membrane protein